MAEASEFSQLLIVVMREVDWRREPSVSSTHCTICFCKGEGGREGGMEGGREGGRDGKEEDRE